MMKMETDIYMLQYRVWDGEDQAWNTNQSRRYALVLMHCPSDLEEVLKTMSAWKVVSKGHAAIGLLKMVCNVAYDQMEAEQMAMGFKESTAELFTYHQDKKASDDDYSVMFNATVKPIKAHGRQPWYHPGLADQHMKWIGKEIIVREPDQDDITLSSKAKIVKQAK